MELSVHDNFLVSYEVLCEQKEIRLHTEYRDVALDASYEYTDVIFKDVFAYHFQQDTLVNIIFDIEEVAVENILSDDKALFEAGRPYGWPWIEANPKLSLETYLGGNAVRGFNISPSMGLKGWVLAKSMEFIAAMPSS